MAGTILAYLLADSLRRVGQSDPRKSGFELASTQGRKGQIDRNVCSFPLPTTVGQLSLTLSWTTPVLYGSDNKKKGSHAGQVNGVSQWQSRKSHWGRNSGLLQQECQTTPPYGQHWGGSALSGFWSLNQERFFFQRLHTNLIFKCVSKTLHSFLLPLSIRSWLNFSNPPLCGHKSFIHPYLPLFHRVDWELTKPVFPLLCMSQDLSHSQAISCPGVQTHLQGSGRSQKRMLQWSTQQN